MASDGWAHCPECKCWVPAESMNYDTEGGVLTRVCNYCLGIEELPWNPALNRAGFVYDPNHGKMQCLYCDGYNTEELVPDWGKFRCRDCGEIFRRNLE